ncbi:MAG: hypothetical protein WAX07_03355 [Candidatus Altiarchaeia archaeon]
MRKTVNAWVKIIFLSILLLSSSYDAFSAASIGLSPGAAKFEGVLRSGYSEKIITLSTSSEAPLNCEITATGPAEKWFSYSVDKNFILNPRSHQALKIMVEPAEDAPNGVYEGYITVIIKPNASVSGGMGSQISTGVSLKYSVEVSDLEKKHYTAPSVYITNDGTTEERMPVEFSVSLENDGNVRLTPRLNIEILSEDKTEVLTTYEYSDKLILPTTRQDFLISVPHTLTIGKYWARFTAYLDDQVVSESVLPLEILERGSLRVRGTLIRVSLNKIWVYTGEIVEVNASFKNDGVVSTPVVFKGKALLDGSVEGLLESDVVEAAPGETVDLTAYFTPKKPGRYSITGKTSFSKKQSAEKSSVLNVRDIKEKPAEQVVSTVPEASGGSIDTNSMLVAAAVLLAAVVIGMILWKARKNPPKNDSADSR